MSFVRAGSRKHYSNSENEGLYVFIAGGNSRYIEDYGALNNPEDFCEVMFRIMDQAGVDLTLEMVNKTRDRMGLEPLEDIP